MGSLQDRSWEIQAEREDTAGVYEAEGYESEITQLRQP